MIAAVLSSLQPALLEGELMEPAKLLKMVLEVTVFTVILYIALRFLRETRGSGVVRGLALLLLAGVIAFFVLIQVLQLDRLKFVFNAIAQSVVMGLVVVFHPEIRRAIVHLGDAPIFGRFFRTDSKIVPRLLRAVARLSKERIGALIAIEREASLSELTENGITIDAELNSYLIESIFFPKSALHDGGVVVRDDRIVAASCLFPLSQNADIDKRLGTRHRAAIGLSEETDALVLVVSEETGKISTASGGNLAFDLTLEQLENQLGNLQSGGGARVKTRRRGSSFAMLFADPFRKLAAVALAVGLWFFVNSQITSHLPRSFPLEAIGPQRLAGAAVGSRLAVVLPTDQVVCRRFLDGDREITGVSVTLSGPRYRIDALEEQSLDLQVTFLSQDWSNRKSVEFTAKEIQRNLNVLEGVHIEMSPSRVTLEVEKILDRPLPLVLEQVELLVDPALNSRLRRETASFSPPTAVLLGPASSLAQFPASGTKPLIARLKPPRANERQLTAILELTAPADLGLRLAETPSITMQVLPDTQLFEVEVPLRVDDLALPADLRGLYRPENATQRVRIKAGGELRSTLVLLDEKGDTQKLDNWAKAHLRLDVWIPPLEPGATYGAEIVREARLLLRGPMQASIDRADCELDKPVSILLRRIP